MAKIVSWAVDESGELPKVIFRLGTKELERVLPPGHGIVRASAILSEKGELVDCELITQSI